jgi:hypothetical protein
MDLVKRRQIVGAELLGVFAHNAQRFVNPRF